MSRTTFTLLSTLAASMLAGAVACDMGQAPSPQTGPQSNPDAMDASTPPGPPGTTVLPFQADPPSVYVAKVKNILVGMPPTDAEVKAVEADPTQLKTLIDGWMTSAEYQPLYTQKMMTFFELAFQQTQVSLVDFADQVFPRQADINASTVPLLVQNARESFARTVLDLVSQQHPLTESMTTQSFMMTPALMEFYAFLDAYQVDDAGKVTDRFRAANPTVTITVEASQGPIPISETLDPTNAHYMTWYDPDVANSGAQGAGCQGDPITYPSSATALHYLIFGSLDGRTNGAGAKCNQYGGTPLAPQLTATDFSTWKMVTIRAPKTGEAPTPFYDLASFRSPTTTELVLEVPRVGFFSTPAFFANWVTNTSNEARVTTNQTLIVALGAAVDGTDPTAPPTTPGIDSAHASQAACFGCHQTLDPTRSILASTYSWNYHNQTEALYASQKGMFQFQNVIKPVNSVLDLGNVLANHPLFPQAWAQKLCYYANSGACETTDPEFKRVVSVFQSSGYSWSALVKELLSSPLTTNAMATQTTTDKGEIIAVSRRDHLCAALNFRLGFADVCGLDALTKAASQTAIPEIVSGLPSDGYGRGSIAPVLPNQPNLFYRAGTENICEAVAGMTIDVPGTKQIPNVKQWSSAQPDAAITDFVQLVMGLAPSDARTAPAMALLKAHFTAATQTGASASDSLKSTFTLACLAPSSVSIGL